MEKGIAVLRGINVSGHRLIKMEALRSMLESLGLKDVQTYIQSGNIVFTTSSLKGLEKKISEKIQKTFGHEVPVLVKSYSNWKDIIGSNPFAREGKIDLSKCHVTFLYGQPDTSAIEKNIPESGNDQFQLVNGTLYLYTPGGYGNTKYSNIFFEKRLKCPATTRNWKTMLTLAKMCEGPEE